VAVVGIAIWSCSSVSADERDAKYAEDIRPLLARYCFACHGPSEPRAKLNLAALREENVFSQPELWHKIRKRLAAAEMPPADDAQPAPEERQRLMEFGAGVMARYTLAGHPDPGTLHPRRFNVREHMNVLRDLAIEEDRGQPRKVSYEPKPDGTIRGIDEVPEHPCAFVARLLPQDTEDGGFDSISENLSIPPHLLDRYFQCHKRLLDDLLASNARKSESYQAPLYKQMKSLEWGPPPRGKSAREAVVAFVAQFATRAFRRPVSAAEAERYAVLFDKSRAAGQDFETSIRLALEAVLISPRCVVLWADTEPATREDAAPVRPLDDYELAARLSIFLWSSVPDAELRKLASEGRLHEPENFDRQVRRMLSDRRVADGLLSGFVCQWLQLDRLNRSAPDAEKYRDYFQNNLAELMNRELLLFADAIVVENRSILEFIDADWGFMCYPLARHYGIEGFAGKKPANNAEAAWYRIKFADQRRGGVLTMGKVLTGTSQPARTSPVQRGKWILETILGAPPPPPPANVDNVLREEVPAGTPNLTGPQLLARHRDNPACDACHRRIDPLGIALENFDPVGRWRDRDRDQPIDARGALMDSAKFDGIVELKRLLLARKQDFARSFVEQMLAYALGRRLEFYDEPTVNHIVQAVGDDDYKFSRVVLEVAKSYPFMHKRTPAARPDDQLHR
jgi:hypothetical protein